MSLRAIAALCLVTTLAAGCASAPMPAMQAVYTVQRDWDYTLAGSLHQLRATASVELHDGLCSGFGKFEVRLEQKLIHSQDVFVVYVPNDRCAGPMPQRVLQFITDSVGTDTLELRSLAKRIVAYDDCLHTGAQRQPLSDVVCNDIVQMDVSRNEQGTYQVITLFTESRMRQCVYAASDTGTPPQCEFGLIE